MLLPSLISFLVRSLYISYYSYWVSVSFCFLFFVFSLIAASEGNLLIPYSVSFSLPSALGRYSIPFSFFFCTLFCVIHHIYLFSFYRVFTAICFLVFLLLPASYFFPPSLKETYGNSFLFNKNSPSRKKKKVKGLITLNKLGRWLVDSLFGTCPLILRDKLPRVKTFRGNLRFLVASERDSFVAKTIITETFCSELFGVTQTFPIQFSSLAPQTV